MITASEARNNAIKVTLPTIMDNILREIETRSKLGLYHYNTKMLLSKEDIAELERREFTVTHELRGYKISWR